MHVLTSPDEMQRVLVASFSCGFTTAFLTCATASREMFWRVCFVLSFPPFLLLLGASALSMWLCTRNLGWGPAVKSKWSHWKTTAVTLKKWTAFTAMEEPWNSLINKVKSLRVSDWLDSLIGPSELLKMLSCSELVTCLLLTLFCYVCGDSVWRKNGHGLYLFDQVNLSCLSI